MGFQADMAHTLLYLLGTNSPQDRLLPVDFDWRDRAALDATHCKPLPMPCVHGQPIFMWRRMMVLCLAPVRTIKPAVIASHWTPMANWILPTMQGYWLRNEKGELTKAFKHICWDGCMFPNAVMLQQKTWNDILGTMIKVREQHGWVEA